MSVFPKRTHRDPGLPADEAMDKLAAVLEGTPGVVSYSVGPVPNPFLVGEIYFSVTFMTFRGRDARFSTTIPRSAALDISRADLLRFFDEHMRRFAKKHDERIAKALRTLPCGHLDATDDALRDRLPCSQCVKRPEIVWFESGRPPIYWPSDSGDAPDDRPAPAIRLWRERFILPTGEPVTRWEREELDAEDEPDEESE